MSSQNPYALKNRVFVIREKQYGKIVAIHTYEDEPTSYTIRLEEGRRVTYHIEGLLQAVGPNDIRIMEQGAETTRDLMRAVLVYVAMDSEPDSYHPDDLMMFRRAFAGDPEAVSYIHAIFDKARHSLGESHPKT